MPTSGSWALPVERKGAQEEVVKWIVDKLDEAGYAGVPITIKSDQEPAMISLKQAIAVRRKAETIRLNRRCANRNPMGELNEQFVHGRLSFAQCATTLNLALPKS